MDVLLTILKGIGFAALGFGLGCFQYIIRAFVLRAQDDFFKDSVKKNIIFYGLTGAVVAIAISIYYYFQS